MKKSKRILSMLTALAITASAFASMVIPASAASTQVGSTYTFDATTDAWSFADNNAECAVDSGVLKFTGGGQGGRSGVATVPNAVTPADTNPIKVEFDWTSDTTTATCSSDIAIADGATKSDISTGRIVTINELNGAISVNGVAVTGAPKVAKVTAVLDFETKRVISVTFTPASGDPVSVYDVPFNNKNATKIDTFVYEGHRAGGQTLASTVTIDNVAFYTVADEYYKATVTVQPEGGDPVADANVKLGRSTLAEDVYDAEYTTDANGQIATKLAPGTYKYSVSKPGCQTADGEGTATGTFTVESAAVTPNVAYGPKVYTPVPNVVTISGGQSSLTAPRTADTLSTTNAYAVTVVDQEGVTRTDANIVWSIAPTDANVEINASTGAVTVKKGFDGGSTHVKEFTVTATATLNSESKAGTAKINISDYLFYDSGLNGSSYGETEAHAVSGTNYITTGSSKNQSNTITLPEPITFTAGTAETLSFDIAMTQQKVYTFKRNISIVGAATEEGKTVDKTIASFDFVNEDIGTDASWSSSNSALGTTWATLSGLNAWQNISILFATYANGTTNAKLTIGTNEYDLGTVEAENISKITLNVGDCGAGTDRYVAMKDVIVKAEDASALDIGGSKKFTSIPDNTITKDYEVLALMIEDGETFSWTTTIPNATITADANDSTKAVLTVPDTVTTGGKIKATSNKSREAEIDVTIETAIPTTYDFTGSTTIQYADGATEKYAITNVKDQNGDDITEYINPTWSLKGREAVTLPKATFTVDASAAGDAVAIFPTYDGTALKSIETAPVKITGTTVEIEGKNGQKVLLWDSLEGVKPLAPVGTITGTDVDDVNYITNTGTLNVNVKQDETVVATVLGQTIEKPVTIADYSKFVTAEEAGEISVADIVTYGATSFNVVLDNGTVIEKTASDNKITLSSADFGDATEAEIIPNYKFDLGGASESGYVKVEGTKADGYGFKSAATPAAGTGTGIQSKGVDLNANSFEVDLPDGRYDITFYKALKGRSHLRVNGYMTVTEADFIDGDDNAVDPLSGPGVYTKLDANVTNGVAVFTADNWDNSNPHLDPLISAVEITKKSEEFQPRKTHIFIAGDSTVCIYRPSPTTDNFAAGTRRTGWGQLLQNYLSDDVIVDDFAHSGDWAANWYANTFPSVLNHAEKGDYLIIQFGINDRTRTPKQEDMKAALVNMVKECRAKGVIPVLQNPELCISQYGDWTGKDEHDKPTGSGHAGYFAVSKTVASEENTLFIDLSDISATLWATLGKTWVTQNYFVYQSAGVTDAQHMSYQGAKLVASMVATEILDQQTAGKKGAAGETFDGIPVNAKVQADITYTDAKDNTQKTVERQAAEFKATVLN